MINYVKGDATAPQGSEPKVILHNVNSEGYWGAGFVLALRKAWPLSETAYRHWAKGTAIEPEFEDHVGTTGPFQLGEVQIVLVGPKLWVANLVGQSGIGRGPTGRAPIRYDAIRTGFQKVSKFCLSKSAGIHMPRLGTGLAGGRWDAVEQLVKSELTSKGVAVTVYDLP